MSDEQKEREAAKSDANRRFESDMAKWLFEQGWMARASAQCKECDDLNHQLNNAAMDYAKLSDALGKEAARTHEGKAVGLDVSALVEAGNMLLTSGRSNSGHTFIEAKKAWESALAAAGYLKLKEGL